MAFTPAAPVGAARGRGALLRGAVDVGGRGVRADAGRWTCCRHRTKKGCFMVACKYSGSYSLPLRDLSLLAARERVMRVLDV
jgi:hypothetical protein